MGQKTNSSAFRAGINNLWKLDSNFCDQGRSNNFSLYSYFFIKKKIKQYKSKIVHFKSQYSSFISFFITIYKFLKKKQQKLKWWQRKKLFEKKFKLKKSKSFKLKKSKNFTFKKRIFSNLKKNNKLKFKCNKKFKLKKPIFFKLALNKKKVSIKTSLFIIYKFHILNNLYFNKILKKYNTIKNFYKNYKINKIYFYTKNFKLSKKNLLFILKKKFRKKFQIILKNKKQKLTKSLINKFKFTKFINRNLLSKRKINKNKILIKNIIKFIKVKIKIQKDLELFFKKSIFLKLQNVFWKLPRECFNKIKLISLKLEKFRSFRGLKDLINIITISSYFFTPELFSDFIASELEITKRQKYLIKILAYTLKNAFFILKTLKGAKFIIWGKVEKSQRTRKFISKWGRVCTTNLGLQTDESLSHCFTKYGVFGVRVIFTK